MKRPVVVVVAGVLVAAVLGFGLGYAIHSLAVIPASERAQRVVLSGYGFSCGPSPQPPYLQGQLVFNLTSTYWGDVVASVGYMGNWTGDTNQLVHANSTKHVVITWGPGMMANVHVTQCPSVNVTIWRVVQTLRACPNPPCDDGTIPAP